MATLFTRTYTFTDGTTAYGSQVEAELAAIVNGLNNLNTANSSWGQVSVLNAVSVPLIADCAAGSQDIADFKNNNVIQASISSGGVISSVATSNQLVLGTTRTITISAGTPASSSRVVSIPDPGTNANFVLSEAAATINGVKTFAGQLIGKGTATNDSAAAGYIGEYIASVVGATGFTTSTHWGDATSILLTAGDWEVTLQAWFSPNGATTTVASIGISQTTGNSTTGLVIGDNYAEIDATNVPTTPMVISGYRVSLSGSATIYAKYEAAFSGGPPNFFGRLSARRIR